MASVSRVPIVSDDVIFSVIVPIYNRADILHRTMQSIFAQTLQDFEVVIVDDGSQDNIEAAVEALGDSRVRLFQQKNKGASAARNTGVDLARGKYVAFLDSDDLFLPHHLAEMKAILDQSEDTAAYSAVICQRGDNLRFIKPPRAIEPGENMATYLICDRGFVQTSGLALHREVAGRVRYREDSKFGDDTDFAIRLQLAGCRFVMAEQPGVIWSDDADHLRLSLGRLAISNLDWLEALRTQIPPRAYHGYRGWHLAKSLMHRNVFQALGLYFRAVAHRAYSPRLAALILLQIVLPDEFYRRVSDFWIGLRGRVKGIRK